VLPSEHESFGIVFLEAWMRQKPVIGNRACGPVASIIEHGTDGYLCHDVADFAARIRFLLDHPEDARALGTAGRTKTMAHYTWDAVGRRVHDLCAQLVAQQQAVVCKSIQFAK
jgi:glycosyltransferase involved in cell wall biosynthesis